MTRESMGVTSLPPNLLNLNEIVDVCCSYINVIQYKWQLQAHSLMLPASSILRVAHSN